MSPPSGDLGNLEGVMITAETFCKIGRALFGDDFRRPLARELRMNPRNVERFATGESAIPESLNMELAQLLRDHVAAQCRDPREIARFVSCDWDMPESLKIELAEQLRRHAEKLLSELRI